MEAKADAVASENCGKELSALADAKKEATVAAALKRIMTGCRITTTLKASTAV